MRARLVPVYFDPGVDDDFNKQLQNIRSLLDGKAEILEPVPLGSPLPPADAAIFPQLLGEAYRKVDALREIPLPILVVTSEFGTLSMWDWEILSFLETEGIRTIAPNSLEKTRLACRILSVKSHLARGKLLVFQDNPGAGFQASIFKRFFWWEDRATELLRERLGVEVEKRSFKALGEGARKIPDRAAAEVLQRAGIPSEGLSEGSLLSAAKLYLAVRREIDGDERIRAVGINCLNESHFSDTTPCLAWNLLYEETGILWGCEADTMSMATKYLLHKCLDAPVMMTNIYPFLMGMAALKHERISSFPEVVEEPENHLLLAHCGYLGVLPRSFATEWTLRPKVLAIVDENAHAIDARLATGDITLAKLDPSLSRLLVVKGSLRGYVQYPGSDCRNGAVVKVSDGYRLLDRVYSHHLCLMTGHRPQDLGLLARVLGLEVENV